ncbi:TPA: hypothetical protein JAN90_16210 [Legionella pneumophila]|nr:hypothetical protein [Legionella pneumophila]HAT8867950.1 hypothetical protein [Legionella pneumophila subsp. pneumophila]HAT7074266.1 hypothetical protein [Legionella pneumophila]HAT8641510.1 hypothetical protein [Legionella pneumophila]HAT8889328.1 hypothetical protein [Legionella pneumophila subsp. pneumophila]HAT8932835.1 hypothetical protein [Legionella pneumophila subsp. pneumophila]
MIELEPEPDTVLDPKDILTEEMKLGGSDNDMDHNQFTRGDEVDLVGDGVPGYETTGQDGTDDEIEEQREARYTPTLNPNPKNVP